MMMVVAISIFYAAAAFFEIAPLKKQGRKKEIALCVAVLLLAYVLSVLITLGVKLPSVDRAVGDIVISITGEQQ